MSISTSDLDFEKIKTKLKTYFKQSDEFGDYDFEASGLSNILDVLAYNTHVNGLTANMATRRSAWLLSKVCDCCYSVLKCFCYDSRRSRINGIARVYRIFS
jgi:hypothetical protein